MAGTSPPSSQRSGSKLPLDGTAYVAERCDPQIAYFEKKANKAKRWHQWSAISIAIVAGAIPVIDVLPLDQTLQRVLTAVLGASVVVIQSTRSIKRWHEDWLLFRNAEETLRAEKMLYLTRTGDYAGEDVDSIFVTRIEKVLSMSHGSFSETHRVTEGPNERRSGSHGAP
jgi:Protein of unknown function (DUF4231)